MEIIKQEIDKDGKKHIQVKYTEEEMAEMKKKAEERRKNKPAKPTLASNNSK